MAKFLLVSPVFVCFAFFVQSSLSLICLNCNLDDCSNPVVEQCLDPGESQKVACLTETFTDNNNKTGYQRKCVIYQDDIETFECADQPTYTTISCLTCTADLCNKAPPNPSSSSRAADVNSHSNKTKGAAGLYRNLTRPYPLPLPFDRRRDDDGDDNNNNDIQQELEKDKSGVVLQF